MSLKKIRYIVDANGNYLHVPSQGIVALEDKASSIQLITPIKGSMAVSFSIYDSSDKEMVQYLAPQTYKAQDVLEETDNYYQMTYDWYVYEIEVRQKFISKISKAHAGRVGISFTGRQAIEHSPAALIYIGSFGRNRVPEQANDGEFIVCELWNFQWGDESLTKGDILYWMNGKWNLERVFVPIMNTENVNLPIDPSVYAYIADETIDKTELENMWLSIGNIQEKVFEVLDSGTRIHITGEMINKVGLTIIPQVDIDVADRIVQSDIIISRNPRSTGHVGIVKYTTATEAVVEYKFALAGVGGSNLVFETEKDLEDWFFAEYERADGVLPEDLFIGQLIFLKEIDVPDYWVSILPAQTINDLSIQESDQSFDRTAVGDTTPNDKFDIWIDTTDYESLQTPFGTMAYSPELDYVEDPGQVEQIEEEQVVDPGEVEQIEEETVIDPGEVEQIEEEQVQDVGTDSGIELPGGV